MEGHRVRSSVSIFRRAVPRPACRLVPGSHGRQVHPVRAQAAAMPSAHPRHAANLPVGRADVNPRGSLALLLPPPFGRKSSLSPLSFICWRDGFQPPRSWLHSSPTGARFAEFRAAISSRAKSQISMRCSHTQPNKLSARRNKRMPFRRSPFGSGSRSFMPMQVVLKMR